MDRNRVATPVAQPPQEEEEEEEEDVEATPSGHVSPIPVSSSNTSFLVQICRQKEKRFTSAAIFFSNISALYFFSSARPAFDFGDIHEPVGGGVCHRRHCRRARGRRARCRDRRRRLQICSRRRGHTASVGSCYSNGCPYSRSI